MKKLQRLPAERKIAGVCAGLGEYFGLDPLLFRLGFLISVAFGGIGLLAYLVMWIMVPAAGDTQHGSLRVSTLHLSATDKKVAGVCGGLGETFGIDPLLFRVAIVILSFICGAGVLLYLALWLLMPRPHSTTPVTPAGDIAA